MMKVPLYKKALWIAEQINDDADNVYDILLGNIKKPTSFVDEVNQYLYEYDTDHEKHIREQ